LPARRKSNRRARAAERGGTPDCSGSRAVGRVAPGAKVAAPPASPSGSGYGTRRPRCG